MTNELVHFGAASKKTLDFSGSIWWDSFLFSLRKMYIVW
jgi:hypothetical protein